MRELTLLRVLLLLFDGTSHNVALATGLSESSVSRHANGLLSKRSTLETLAKFMSEQTGTACDANLLIQKIDGKTLIALADYIRQCRLMKGNKNGPYPRNEQSLRHARCAV